MSALTIMNEKVLPIVRDLYDKVDTTKYKKVAGEVEFDMNWVASVAEEFQGLNEVFINTFTNEILEDSILRLRATELGIAFRRDMGEEMFQQYKEDNGILGEFELGIMFVMENLFMAIVQKVHDFPTVELLGQTILVAQDKGKHMMYKEGAVKLIRIASELALIKIENKTLNYDVQNEEEFESKFIDRLVSGGVEEGELVKSTNIAIQEVEGAGAIFAHIAVELGLSELESIFGFDVVISRVHIMIQRIALRVSFLSYMKMKPITEEFIESVIEGM